MSAEPDRYKKAKIKAARYCVVAERSPRQVREKLIKYGLSPAEASRALTDLTKDKFVNSERFAKAYANDKFRFNKWGKHRIRMELKSHEIPLEEVELGLGHIDQGAYEEVIFGLLADKWEQTKKDQIFLSRKKKTVDYLLRKGFEHEIVARQMDKLIARNRRDKLS